MSAEIGPDHPFKRLVEDLEARDRARAESMPTEAVALQVLMEAYVRLKELGWNDIQYCPKDGSAFDSISVGCTGIHRAYYEGVWPKGSWWVEDGGDLWPARPILYRRSPDELARWTALRARWTGQA